MIHIAQTKISQLMKNELIATGKYLHLPEIFYVPRFMAQFGLPTRELDAIEHIRRNNNFRVSMIAPSNIGLPFGIYPRLMLFWLTTEIKIKGQRDIYLGKNINLFMKSLGKSSSGGANGSLTSIRKQSQRLFSSYFNWELSTHNVLHTENMLLASEATFLWESNQSWQGHIRVSEDFFNHVFHHAYPVCRQTILALGRNIFAVDIYLWLAYRLPLVGRPILVDWEKLVLQFGNNFKRKSNFKRDFNSACELVLYFYSDAKIRQHDNGILLLRSAPHIRKLDSG